MFKHQISQTECGWRLKIWEPAPKTEKRVRPFLFSQTIILASPEECHEEVKKFEQLNALG